MNFGQQNLLLKNLFLLLFYTICEVTIHCHWCHLYRQYRIQLTAKTSAEAHTATL